MARRQHAARTAGAARELLRRADRPAITNTLPAFRGASAAPAGVVVQGVPGMADVASAATLDPRWQRRLAILARLATTHAEALTIAAVLLAATAHLLRIFDRGFNLLDEGFVLSVAERMLMGQVPYRDFFTQLTPGAFMALAAVFSVTGPSVMAGRWVTLVLGVFITFLLYWGARRTVSRPTAALAAMAFPVWSIGQGWFYPNYSWFALAAGIAALCCTLRAQREMFTAPAVARVPLNRSALVWLAAGGLLCGVSGFCKQNIGLYSLLALVAATLAAGPGGWRGRAVATVVLGATSAIVPLGLLIWLAAEGALTGFLRDAVWIPLRVFPRDMAAPYPAFWPPWPLPTDKPGHGEWAFRLVCLLPPLPYALSLLTLAWTGLIRRRPGLPVRRAACVAWLAFGLAIWVTAFPRADFDHVQVALGPAFVVGAASFEAFGRLLVRRKVWRAWQALPFLRAAGGARWSRRWLPQTLACGLIGGFLVAGVDHARLLHMGPGWSLRGIESVSPRAAGLRLDHDEAAELNHLIGEVRRLTVPGQRMASLPWNAGLYFLAERPNVSRFDLFIPASVLPEDMPEIRRSLAEADLVVYWTPRDPFVNNTSFDDRYPDLHEYLMANFRFAAAVNAYRLLVPAIEPAT